MSPFASAILTPVSVALGSILHNYAYSRGMLGGTMPLPLAGTGGANVTKLGVGGGLLSVLFGYFGHGKTWPSLISHVGAGMFAEGLNVPNIEALTRPSTGGAGAATGAMIPEYVVPQYGV